MSDNPRDALASAFHLSEYGVVRLEGHDAAAFAQAQFMNDVATLHDGDWHWSGWLNPKGRVQALFALLRLDAQTIWLVGVMDAPALASALGRFVFRSKVKVSALPAVATGRLAAPARARGASCAADGGLVELDLGGEGGPRSLLLATDDLAAEPSGIDDATGAAAWWALDVAHGWPALPGTSLDAWTPQQLSLERLRAFSVKKGCYPGQEIVARTHFLGRAKRGLVRLTGAGVGSAADVSGEDGRVVGQVVCAVGEQALAVLPLEREDAPLQVGGQPCEVLPLLGGLERSGR